MHKFVTLLKFMIHILCNRSQMTSKCVKNKKSGTRAADECVTDGQFILYNKEKKIANGDVIYNMRLSSNR